MKFSLVEISLINDAVGELEIAFAFFPVVALWAFVVGLAPLRHFDFYCLINKK